MLNSCFTAASSILGGAAGASVVVAAILVVVWNRRAAGLAIRGRPKGRGAAAWLWTAAVAAVLRSLEEADLLPSVAVVARRELTQLETIAVRGVAVAPENIVVASVEDGCVVADAQTTIRRKVLIKRATAQAFELGKNMLILDVTTGRDGLINRARDRSAFAVGCSALGARARLLAAAFSPASDNDDRRPYYFTQVGAGCLARTPQTGPLLARTARKALAAATNPLLLLVVVCCNRLGRRCRRRSPLPAEAAIACAGPSPSAAASRPR